MDYCSFINRKQSKTVPDLLISCALETSSGAPPPPAAASPGARGARRGGGSSSSAISCASRAAASIASSAGATQREWKPVRTRSRVVRSPRSAHAATARCRAPRAARRSTSLAQHRVVLDDGDRAGGDGRELHAAREVALAPRLLGRRDSGRAGRGGKETLVSITRRAASVARMVYGVPRVMGGERKQWGKRRRERENEVGGGTPDWLCMRLPREDSPPSSTTAKNTNPSLAPSRHHTHFCIYVSHLEPAAPAAEAPDASQPPEAAAEEEPL